MTDSPHYSIRGPERLPARDPRVGWLGAARVNACWVKPRALLQATNVLVLGVVRMALNVSG